VPTRSRGAIFEVGGALVGSPMRPPRVTPPHELMETDGSELGRHTSSALEPSGGRVSILVIVSVFDTEMAEDRACGGSSGRARFDLLVVESRPRSRQDELARWQFVGVYVDQQLDEARRPGVDQPTGRGARQHDRTTRKQQLRRLVRLVPTCSVREQIRVDLDDDEGACARAQGRKSQLHRDPHKGGAS
jgi:hypothetical protein